MYMHMHVYTYNRTHFWCPSVGSWALLYMYVSELTYSIENIEVDILYVEATEGAIRVDKRSSHDKEQSNVDPAMARSH